MGQCYDRLRRDDEALDAFRRYLSAVPETPHRAQVEARIRALEQAVARRAQPDVSPEVVARGAEPAPTTPDSRATSGRRARRITLITTSAVVVVAAVVLGVVFATRDDASYASSDVGTVFALRGGAP